MKYSNYDDDDNDRGLSLPVIYTMIAMAGIVLIVILVVVSQNTRSSNRKTDQAKGVGRLQRRRAGTGSL